MTGILSHEDLLKLGYNLRIISEQWPIGELNTLEMPFLS